MTDYEEKRSETRHRMGCLLYTSRVPRGQSIESGGHGLKAAAEKSRAKCIRERMR